nr:hypothetical protein [Cupriavidus respiraculi]
MEAKIFSSFNAAELSEMDPRCLAVRICGIVDLIEPAEMNPLTEHPDFRAVFAPGLDVANALDTRGRICAYAAVPLVLRLGANAQVDASVVERVMVDVINNHVIGCTRQKPVKQCRPALDCCRHVGKDSRARSAPALVPPVSRDQVRIRIVNNENQTTLEGENHVDHLATQMNKSVAALATPQIGPVDIGPEVFHADSAISGLLNFNRQLLAAKAMTACDLPELTRGGAYGRSQRGNTSGLDRLEIGSELVHSPNDSRCYDKVKAVAMLFNSSCVYSKC